ncbi:MAG: RtcB family protein [Chloroflexi bacterium]|nr:RtcB family protein [Chloroflexota bacterium]
MNFNDLKKTGEVEWVIPSSYRTGMKGDVYIIASHEIIQHSLADLSLEQAVNATFLPGLVGNVVVMPDVHQGYGFPIGGIAATDTAGGAISPGAIGYDINCGVRLMASHVTLQDASVVLADLLQCIYTAIPSGLGKGGLPRLSMKNLDAILTQGSGWALQNGYADQVDLNCTEDNGCMKQADPTYVSIRAKERGLEQVGSLGAGNHFIEISVVDKIFSLKAAEVMGLEEGCLCIMIHSGSRGLGHQVCADYVQQLQNVQSKYGYTMPDRELACAPLHSKEGQAYLSAMNCAANYAFCNRQVMAYRVQIAFEEVLKRRRKNPTLAMVYDLAHNIGKIEKHSVENVAREVCVHRKGATRAFPVGSSLVPEQYHSIGHPVLIPGSMGTASWVLVGRDNAMQISFGSACHGAGRVHSRKSARKLMRSEQLINELKMQGIEVMAGSLSGLAEETPQAYKDVDEVVGCVSKAGLVDKVARLRPVAVIKG